MNFIVENWRYLAAGLIIVVGGILAVIRFMSMSAEERYEQIQAWLLQAVLMAEKEFGSGTGRLKLSSVYDKFCGRFPWLVKVISFELFSSLVDDSLVEMRELLAQNKAIASVVAPADEEGAEQ